MTRQIDERLEYVNEIGLGISAPELAKFKVRYERLMLTTGGKRSIRIIVLRNGMHRIISRSHDRIKRSKDYRVQA